MMNRKMCFLCFFLSLLITGCGSTYEEGKIAFDAKDFSKAATIFRELADKGVASAQYRLARMHVTGQGVPKSEEEAKKLYFLAAESGHAKAQVFRGLLYSEGGYGTAKDPKLAAEWFKKAADQGNADGQYWLGLAFLNGEGVMQDNKEFEKWLLKASEQGLIRAQQGLGAAYLVGKGCVQNDEEGKKWLRKAAEQGDVDSQASLGWIYAQDKPQADYQESFKWYQMAADQGNFNSCFSLALMYASGQGTEKNLVQAYAYCALAALQSNPDAEKLRDAIANELSEEQLTSSKSLMKTKATEIAARLGEQEERIKRAKEEALE